MGIPFVVTFELKPLTPYQKKVVNRRMECGRQVFNTCLGLLLKRYRGLTGDPVASTGQ